MTTTTETKPTFQPIDELRYSSIDAAKLSPDGKKIVYSVRKVDLDKEKEFTHLWLLEVESGAARQITYGEHNNSAPNWSPDGKTIGFLSNRAGKAQIFAIPSGPGEAVQLTHLKQGAGSGPVWSPDGKHIAFTVSPHEEPRDPSKPYRMTRAIYRSDGVGYLDDAVQNVFVVPVTSEGSIQAGEPRQLTNDAMMDSVLEWSPDGSEVLFTSLFKPTSMAIFSARLSTVTLEGATNEIMGEEWGNISSAAWLPDGRHIALYATLAGSPGGSKSDLWVVDRQVKTPVCRSKAFSFGFDSGKKGPLVLDKDRALCSIMRAGMGEIYEFSLSGKPAWKPIVTGQRMCAGLDVRGDKLLFITNRLHNPSEICLAGIDGSGERQLTSQNDEWMDGIDLPEVERFVFKKRGSVPVEGWFLKPAIGNAPYPTILCVHGGPYGMYGYGFRSDFQMLAGAGYGLLFINPQGSNGYGDDFSRPLNASWGLLDFPEQIRALDHVIGKGLADPQRLGVNGLSYGGYMTCWAVGQTDRFKAAVAENPVTNIISQYGTSDVDAWDAPFSLGGAPHENYDRYVEISPISYAHHCKTPTLLILGECDYRCPAEQSEQFYTVLKANGCIVEMLRLPGASHAGSINGAIPVRKAQNEALLEWMDKYVRGDSGLSQ